MACIPVDRVLRNLYKLIDPFIKCICSKFEVNQPSNVGVITLLVNFDQETDRRTDGRTGGRYDTYMHCLPADCMLE